MTNQSTSEYGKAFDRWKPIYGRRPFRNVHYFGVDRCVPLIEAEKRQVKINYSTSTLNEKIISTILQKASHCFNREYTAYNIHDDGKGKKFIGVQVADVKYSALSMSAGEQKLFLLLEKVFRADKYSLILIEEIDLLLHDFAMKNLIEVLSQRANERNLQIIFTTHRESILDSSEFINIRHIYNTTGKTFCFEDTKPDAINRLTGKQLRPIEVFVEDDLTLTIVRKVAAQLGISRFVFLQRYGSAINCFTILAGLLLKGEKCEHSLFVLDGDVYRTQENHVERLEAVLTGDDDRAKALRQSALNKITCLNLPEGTKPEKYIHSLILGLNHNDSESKEIIELSKGINAVDKSHRYVDDIIMRLDLERNTGLSKIIDLVSSSDEWENYVRKVKCWFESKLAFVQELK